MGTIYSLNRRVYVRAEPGDRVTRELVSSQKTLGYFAALLTGIRPEALRLGDLVRWIARGDRVNVWRQ